MQQNIARVQMGRLYQSEREKDSIVVGTSAWYDWLEHNTVFFFVDHVSAFTARKGGTDLANSDWQAYRTHQRKIYRVRLGYSDMLTLDRLQAAARILADEHAQAVQIDTSPVEPRASQRQQSQSRGNNGLGRALIQTQLHRPRNSSDVIQRARLIERLNAGLSCTATLLSASAGFGKTTLLAQWLESTDRFTAWLSLDEHDNEPPNFVYSLAAALQTVFPDAFQATASLLKATQFPSPNQVATIFINDLADMPGDVILVLDDYHLIRNDKVHALLDLLIEHLPPQLHLVLISRSDPPLPIARWRAQGRLNELRGDDLRFTLEETEAFLSRVLPDEHVHETSVELAELTEGWIAVLRMAALSLRSTSDRAAFLERLRHYPDRSISNYLVEEILAQLSPAMQEFLVQTSVLDQFCPELCVAILGRGFPLKQVQSILDWLERSNLLLVPLDSRQGWYRFHHLFQQRLQMQNSQEKLARLHSRASAWYTRQGLIEQAIEHALAAGDTMSAAHLVEAHFLPAFEQEQLGQIERWLQLLPDEQIQASPVLLFARAWILQAHGQLSDLPRLLTAAEQLLESNASVAHGPDNLRLGNLHALILALWCQFHFFTGQVQKGLENAQSALALLSQDEEYTRSFVLLWNNLDTALYHFSVVIANQHHAHFWVVQDAMCGLALIYHAQELSTQAQEMARSWLELVQEQHNQRDLVNVYAFQGKIALLQDRLEEAEQWLEMAGEQTVLGPMAFLEDPPNTKARLLLTKGDEASVAHGQTLLEKLLQHVEAIRNTPKMIQVLALQAWAYDLQGQEVKAREVLERALALASPGGYIRTFVDLPPVARSLNELRKHRKVHQVVDQKGDTYIQGILSAMTPLTSQAIPKEELLQNEGLEPLTNREVQILRLLEKDLTNKEIARKLVVTTGTVKVHTNNVYRKLSVNNRHAAVTLARTLGFLASEQTIRPLAQ
jgi:LuxR family maltose regulon positive regulatory protein